MTAIAFPQRQDFTLVTLFGSEPKGWQSLFPGVEATALGCAADSATARNLLASRLDQAVTGADRAVLLLAEGAGCLAAAWWARLTPAAYVSRVKGAMFFAPSDADDAHDTFASPRIKLPFPSILVEEGESSPRLRSVADQWGTRIVSHPRVDADRLLRRTQRVLSRFTSAVVARDVEAAERLIGAKPLRAV